MSGQSYLNRQMLAVDLSEKKKKCERRRDRQTEKRKATIKRDGGK